MAIAVQRDQFAQHVIIRSFYLHASTRASQLVTCGHALDRTAVIRTELATAQLSDLLPMVLVNTKPENYVLATEIVTVTLPDGRKVKATCYNLPSDWVVGVNQRYAESLLRLARDLEFPESYLQQIREAQNAE